MLIAIEDAVKDYRVQEFAARTKDKLSLSNLSYPTKEALRAWMDQNLSKDDKLVLDAMSQECGVQETADWLRGLLNGQLKAH